MKFIVSSSLLYAHLQSVGKVVNPKSQLQILENFLFKIAGDKLTVTASDVETTLTTTLTIQESDEDITIALSAKLLMDILREFSDQPLTFEIDSANLSVVMTSESGSYTFIGLRGDEYPKYPELTDESKSFELPCETILDAIAKCGFAAADDELRPVMCGIFFDIKNDNISFVATDAHKLVKYGTTLPNGDLEASFILPKKPAAMLKTLLAKEKGNANISFDQKNIHFSFEGYSMISRQIEGRYPDYNRVIPQDNPIKVIVDRLVILNAVRRVAVFANLGTSLIKLSFINSSITITAQDIDFSTSAKEVIPCQYNGDEISIGFKANFLVDILNNISASDVVIELSDPSRAGIILPFDPDEDILMLLMPMLLN